jgi:hypothetical protein
MNKNIAVARLWHRRGKYEYFGLKQLIDTFPTISFDFHIVLDQDLYEDEWTSKISDLNLNIVYYTKDQLKEYVASYLGGDQYDLTKFIHFYHIAIGHYLRRVHLYDYMLTYEYDVIFNSKELPEVEECLVNKIPFGISEPLNQNCDKALYNQLCQIFQTNLIDNLTKVNSTLAGVNAGFQGVNLRMFDEFLSQSGFNAMMSLFDFSGTHKEDGTEKWGVERTVYDTQEQSFYGLLNQVHSPNYKVLDQTNYFFHPCWDDFPGYVEKALESKVVHFTGHIKSKKMFELIEDKLKTNTI